MTAPAPASAPARQQWADVAKGVCILLVVLWHVIMKHYLQIDWRLPVPLPGAWGTFGDMLLPLRMPVFFAISGMLAANAVQRPWGVVARTRVAKFFYLYAVWFAIHTSVLLFTPGFDTLAADSFLEIVEQLTITPTNLWYLMALAVYFVIAKVTRSLPPAVVLGGALALSAIASAGLLAAPGNRGQLYQNLLFFLAGLRFRPWVERWAATTTARRFAIGAAVYLVAVAAIQVTGTKQVFGVWPVMSGLAVLVGVSGAVLLARVRRLNEPLTRLGRSTLPIYVMHMPILALMDAALRSWFSKAGLVIQLPLAAVLPIALTALLTVTCLSLHRWILAARGQWLFTLPERSPAQPPASTPDPAPAMAPASAAAVGEQPTMELPVVRWPGQATTYRGIRHSPGEGNGRY